MPNQPPAAGAGTGGQQPAEAQTGSGWQSIAKNIAAFLAMQAVMRYGMSYFGMSGKPARLPASAGPASPGSTVTPADTTPGKMMAHPLWPIGTPMSMVLYLSTSETSDDVDLAQPLLTWDDLTFGNWKDERDADLVLDVPESVRNHNGSWWMDVKLVKDGGSPEGKKLEDVATYRKQLVRYLPFRRARKEKKLIGGDESEEHEVEELVEQPKQQIIGHWSRNLTLTVISDASTPVDVKAINPAMKPHYLIVPGPAENTLVYYPPMFPNDFWLLRENLYAINDTLTQLPLRVNYQALSSMKFGIFSTMTASMEQQAAQSGSGAEIDEVKRMLTETSPWLLITTGVVTVLHMLFEFLAFSSDVSHWRKKDKDLVGVSLNTIVTNCIVQLVILLYLHDSSEETSFMILFGQGIGLVIEAWKITKVVDIKVRENPNSLIGYSVQFENKRELTEDEKRTQEYDQLAFRLVSYGAIPLLLGYTGYSLVYETHRGWYSFIVTTLAQAIYMFGFVQLVPQLIINYKLKSVAHMPMKAMMYKTLSTVVDDFLLACFRDDVVFLILLYQRWIYRVDYSRVNEYGQVVEGMAEPVGDKDKADGKETKKTK